MGSKNCFGVHWAWVVLASSFVTLFVAYSIRIGAYSVLLPEMIQDLDLNMTQAGAIRSSYFFAYLLFSPLMGWLTDRVGGRFIISFFCFFLGIGTFLMGYASNLSTAILFHGIVGVGASAMWIPIVAMIQRWFGSKRRGMALGILSPSYSLGFGMMGMVLPLVVKTYSWRMGWILLGLSGIILVVMNGLLLRNDPKQMGLLPWGETSTSPQPSSPPPAFQYLDILRNNHFWLMGASYFFISIGAYIISDFIVTYGVIELKIDYPVASAFISVLAASSIAGGLVLMSLSDSIGRKNSLVIIHMMVALNIVFLILAREDLFLLRVGIGCFGFFYGAIWPMYGACVRDYFPKEWTGTVFGLMTIFYGIGAMVSPVLTGYLTDTTGTFRWPFGIGAFTAFTAALLTGFLKRPIED